MEKQEYCLKSMGGGGGQIIVQDDEDSSIILRCHKILIIHYDDLIYKTKFVKATNFSEYEKTNSPFLVLKMKWICTT